MQLSKDQQKIVEAVQAELTGALGGLAGMEVGEASTQLKQLLDGLIQSDTSYLGQQIKKCMPHSTIGVTVTPDYQTAKAKVKLSVQPSYPQITAELGYAAMEDVMTTFKPVDLTTVPVKKAKQLTTLQEDIYSMENGLGQIISPKGDGTLHGYAVNAPYHDKPAPKWDATVDPMAELKAAMQKIESEHTTKWTALEQAEIAQQMDMLGESPYLKYLQDAVYSKAKEAYTDAMMLNSTPSTGLMHPGSHAAYKAWMDVHSKSPPKYETEPWLMPKLQDHSMLAYFDPIGLASSLDVSHTVSKGSKGMTVKVNLEPGTAEAADASMQKIKAKVYGKGIEVDYTDPNLHSVPSEDLAFAQHIAGLPKPAPEDPKAEMYRLMQELADLE